MKTTEDVRATAARLELVRASAGLTQKEIAKTLGISERAYQSYERGERALPDTVVRECWRALRVDPVWLLIGEGEMRRDVATGVEDHGPMYADQRLGKLSELLEMLDQDSREAIIRDALSRAASAQQIQELSRALDALRKDCRRRGG